MTPHLEAHLCTGVSHGCHGTWLSPCWNDTNAPTQLRGWCAERVVCWAVQGTPVHTHGHCTHSQAVPQLLRVTRRPQGLEALLQGGHCGRRGQGQEQPGLHQAVPTRVRHPPCLCPGTWVPRLGVTLHLLEPGCQGLKPATPTASVTLQQGPGQPSPQIVWDQGPGPRKAQGLCGAAFRRLPWVWGGGCRPPGVSTL